MIRQGLLKLFADSTNKKIYLKLLEIDMFLEEHFGCLKIKERLAGFSVNVLTDLSFIVRDFCMNTDINVKNIFSTKFRYVSELVKISRNLMKKYRYLRPANILAILPLLLVTKTSLSSQTIKSSAAIREEKDVNGASSSLLAIVSLV